MNELCGKCRKKTKDPIIKCAGNCNMVYHLKCVEVQSTEYDAVQNCRGIRWFCDLCLEVLNYVWELKNDIVDLQKQVSSEMTELRNIIHKIRDTVKEEGNLKSEKKSYAKVTSEVVIIKPKNTGQDSKKTLEVVQKHVSPSVLEVGISEVRPVKEGGVVIKCNSKEEINRVKTVVEKKLGKNYKINTPDLKNPHIKIVDIDSEMKDEELLDNIKRQNLFLNHNLVSLNVRVIKKMRSKWMAIVECDPESFKKIMKENGLYINWSRCRVYEYVSVLRCFKCGGFGHKVEQCINKSRCTHCAGPVSEHDSDQKCECDSPRCINCIDTNVALKTNFDINHSTFAVNCPVLLEKMEIQRRKIRYSVDNE